MALELTIRQKLVGSTVIPVALTFTVGLIGYFSIGKLADSNELSIAYARAIRLNVETDMFHELIPENSDHKRRVAASIPVGRVGWPEDVAAAVRFFLSAEADFITGQNLFVCGGASLGQIHL